MYKIFHKNKYVSGMTLVELIVVISIFVIVSVTVLFNYGGFRNSVTVQNLADDIALTIRRAQSFAIGVRSAESSAFNTGYGIHFSTLAQGGNTLSGSNKAFVLFADISGDKLYTYPAGNASCGSPSVTNECVDMLSITSADTIQSICVGAICTYTTADISFIRPNPDAVNRICVGGICTHSSVDIVIKDALGQNTKTITIYNVGQISVK